MLKSFLCLAIFLGLLPASAREAPPASRYALSGTLEIAKVPADLRVGFCLLTSADRQYAAYYDADRNMTVASRRLDSSEWVYQTLPSEVGWDSHNYVTMALDSAGHLHVSGNMHVDSLVYFRTSKSGDITTLRPREMTGELENRVTYPRFFKDRDDRLVFTYRHGGSGNGTNLYKVYDPSSGKWSRLLDTPLFDGEGKRNAYPAGPTLGPDGWFHLHWVWRDTPDAATNQHLSYARSRDLVQWESAFGEKVALPILFGDGKLLVDGIPTHGGIINGGHKLAFAPGNQPVIAYHRNDAAGNMQIYAARPQGGTWKSRVLTDWKQPVNFGGGGSLGFIGIRITGFENIARHALAIGYRHESYGSGTLQIDPSTLAPVEKRHPVIPELPRELRKLDSDFPGMGIRRALDIGESSEDGVRYVLQWETLGPNRDRPRQPPLPQPSTLRLHRLEQVSE